MKKYENDAKKAATSCGKCNSILDDSLVGYSLQICGVAGLAPIFVRLSTTIPRGLSFFTAFFRVGSPSFEVNAAHNLFLDEFLWNFSSYIVVEYLQNKKFQLIIIICRLYTSSLSNN